jgi:hypothetical protein
MNPELHENRTENGVIPSKNRTPNKTGRVWPLLYIHTIAARDTIWKADADLTPPPRATT